MYSTKRVNKNMVDGNAYITINDPYKSPQSNPFRNSGPKKDGKEEKKFTPFQTKMIPQNAENGFFSRLQYTSSGYAESIKYLDNQPIADRKKGFGSHDAKRRDEFANAIRTEQYRSTISKESSVLAKSSEMLQTRLQDIMNTRAQSSPATLQSTAFAPPEALYDIGRSRVTAFDPKASRDTFYKFSGDAGKRFGDYRPTSTDFGDGAWDIAYKPPAHGGRSETKNFFDKSHLNVPRL